MTVIRLEHTARPWSLNDERSAHWRAHRERTQSWRQAWWVIGVAARRRFTGPVHIRARPVYRTRHTLVDTGNCYPAVKAAVDGLVDARVIGGDTGAWVRSIRLDAPGPADHDGLIIEVEDAAE